MVLQGKFCRLRLRKTVLERSSEIFTYLPLLLFWFVLLQELTSMSFWCIYNPCLKPNPKYLQISYLCRKHDIELSFCLTVANILGALGLLAWIPWPHNLSEIAAFPGYPCSWTKFPPPLICQMPRDRLKCSAWMEKFELVVCWIGKVVT